MRMGRSKSKLVPENYGPSRRLRGQGECGAASKGRIKIPQRSSPGLKNPAGSLRGDLGGPQMGK
jgi:hypothetical protein